MLVAETRPTVEARGVTAHVDATFNCAHGKTQLLTSKHTAPLKIAKVFPRADGALDVCLMDCSPGLLNGDRYELDWRVEDDAHVKVTTQSFTKVHPSSGAGCRHNTCIRIASNSVLEYLPQPTMLFRDADFRTSCVADIATGGTLLLSDILCAGRIGHGEVFAFRNYRNRMTVQYDDELIFCNQSRFQPHQQNLRAISAWGASTHYGNFYIFSSAINAALVETMREILGTPSNVISGVSLTHKNGIAVSALANSAWSLQELFARLSSCAKRHVCHA
jgi:urease accessory protein